VTRMTSPKKIAANRHNARKSTGPRTERGKSQVRRNALRHGLAQMTAPASAVSNRIERMARAIAGEGAPSSQYELALIIAESEDMVLRVRAAGIAVIERARAMVQAPSRSIQGFPTNHEWAQALGDLADGRPRDASKLLTQAAKAVSVFTAKILASDQENKTEQAGADQRSHELQDKDNILQTTSPAPSSTTSDEAEVLRRALPELIRLQRYAQRALSRRWRAIRKFVAMSELRDAHALEDKPNEETCED
jgi:hypothetical protein